MVSAQLLCLTGLQIVELAPLAHNAVLGFWYTHIRFVARAPNSGRAARAAPPFRSAVFWPSASFYGNDREGRHWQCVPRTELRAFADTHMLRILYRAFFGVDVPRRPLPKGDLAPRSEA